MSTYRVEWPCCDSATETEGWEPESCPFCTRTPPVEPIKEADVSDADRIAFLAPPGNPRMIEQEKGLFRVYEDVAMKQDPRHKWQAIEVSWSPTAREAIDAAIRALRGRTASE